MLTARGIALVVGGVLLWLLGRTLGVTELFLAAGAAPALVGLAALAVHLTSARVAVRRSVEATRLPAGGTTPVTLDLRNDGRLLAPPLLVEDDSRAGRRGERGATARFVVAGLRPRRTVSAAYRLACEQRGRYTVGPLRVRVRDPFGLAERLRTYPETSEVLVYPRVEPLPDGVARGSHRGSEASDTRRLFNTGDEFYGLREYVTGDDLRQVHWPSTARQAKLMVRQLELPWQPELLLFCDTRGEAHHGTGDDSTLEKAVSVTASLAVHFADRRYELRLATEAGTRPPQRTSLPNVLERLAEVEPTRRRSLAPALSALRSAEAGGLLAAVLAPPPGTGRLTDDPDVRSLLVAGRRFGGRLAVVVGPPGGRTDALAALLVTAGWHATTLDAREPLGGRWHALVAGRAGTGHCAAGARP